jgi:hypothetical protein
VLKRHRDVRQRSYAPVFAAARNACQFGSEMVGPVGFLRVAHAGGGSGQRDLDAGSM